MQLQTEAKTSITWQIQTNRAIPLLTKLLWSLLAIRANKLSYHHTLLNRPLRSNC